MTHYFTCLFCKPLVLVAHYQINDIISCFKFSHTVSGDPKRWNDGITQNPKRWNYNYKALCLREGVRKWKKKL